MRREGKPLAVGHKRVAAREAAQTFHSSDSQLRTGSEDPTGDDHPQGVTASCEAAAFG